MKTTKRLWNLIQLVAEREVKKRFDFSFETFDYDKIEGPLFIIPNHVTAWDPLLIGLTTGGRRLAFVASEHVLRVPWLGAFLKKHMDIIPHRKAGGGTLSVKECLKRTKEGEAIFIASEGEQSWDGESYKVVPTTGKLLKKSGATVVTVLIEGGYLAKPRWADNTRKGRIHIRPVNVYTPEQLSAMTPEEIMDAINKDIRFNIWEWQKGEKQNKYIANKGGIAEGIERLFYICPKCEEIGSLTTGGSEIKCRCGYKVSMLETGFLDPIDPFETIKDWSDWQDSELKKRIEHFKGTEDSTLLFQDENLTLTSIDNKHNEALVASGKLSLAMGDEGLILSVGGEEGKRFYLENIESMAMILYNRIVFSTDGMYYEIKPDNMKGRINLRKYLVAWQLIHNPRKDSGEV